MEETEIRYLKSLAKQYPTIASAATEIINLKAILSLPKGTEHFITDVHGEYEAEVVGVGQGDVLVGKELLPYLGIALGGSGSHELAAVL